MGNAEGKRAQKAPHVSHFSNSCPELNRICFFFLLLLFNSINNSEISEIFPHVDSCRGKLAEGGEGRTNSDQNLTHSWKNPLGKKNHTWKNSLQLLLGTCRQCCACGRCFGAKPSMTQCLRLFVSVFFLKTI